jgi:GNAT superfamily N-acetyltransferase
MGLALSTRRGGPADVDVVLANVQAGFDSYTAFAPVGWRPPDVSADRRRTTERLAERSTWVLIAFAGEQPVGHVGFFPARENPGGGSSIDPRERPVIPGLAHLWQLFVLPPWWGSGVASALHDAAIEEMGARGFPRARLYTPSLQARARHFYERRGWLATGELEDHPLGLAVTEYQRELSAQSAS